jgi:hypothetical protein
MKITKQKFYLLCIAFLFVTSFISAQTVQKIGQNAMTIDPNAVLELQSETKGLLLPRLALVATDSFAPMVSSPQGGMTVYNTTPKSGVEGLTEVTPGFYYWDGAQWVRVADSSSNTMTITTKVTDYTAFFKDNTILFDLTGVLAGATLTLPAPSNNVAVAPTVVEGVTTVPGTPAFDCTGKIYVIRKVDISNYILTFSQAITTVTGDTFTSLNYAKTIRIQSDGTKWNLID